MSIKIGDKVRFLNSVGGGIIVRFIGKERVGVEDQDGFEIPALIKECVVIREGSSALEKAFAEAGAERGNDLALPLANSVNTGHLSSDSSVKHSEGAFDLKKNRLAISEIKGGNRLTIALAFLPNSLHSLQEGNFEAYIINDSNYFLMLNYSIAEKEEFSNVYAGIIEPNSKCCIDEFDRFDLTKMNRLLVQAIAFKDDKLFSLKTPIHYILKLDATKFYRLHSFVENEYFDEKAYMIPIVEKDSEVEKIEIDSARLKQSMTEKLSLSDENSNTHPISSVKTNKNGVIEVDLHIHELLDDYRSMSNSEIIKVQLDYFHQVMREHLSRKGQKIVFIHGKGEGVLRKALLDELKQKYGKCLFQDASFKEYGFGATMIIIK